MTFRRFLTWIVEKLVEWQLFAGLLILVKFAFPTSPGNYVSWQAFTAGASSQWSASIDEAAYMTRAFMGGSYFEYGLKTYEAAAYIVGIHLYFWSFYLATSILACVIGPKGYLPRAWLALAVSAVVLGVRLRDQIDIGNACVGGVLFLGGLIVVTVSALFGEALDRRLRDGPKPRAPNRSADRRVRFDLDLSS